MSMWRESSLVKTDGVPLTDLQSRELRHLHRGAIHWLPTALGIPIPTVSSVCSLTFYSVTPSENRREGVHREAGNT